MAFTYTRHITDEEEKLLKDYILDPKDWIDKAILGKINKSVSEGAKRRKTELEKKGVTNMPSSDIEIMRNAFTDPDYKNRETRDMEEALRGR